MVCRYGLEPQLPKIDGTITEIANDVVGEDAPEYAQALVTLADEWAALDGKLGQPQSNVALRATAPLVLAGKVSFKADASGGVGPGCRHARHREEVVGGLIKVGMTNQQIADETGWSKRTVERLRSKR